MILRGHYISWLRVRQLLPCFNLIFRLEDDIKEAEERLLAMVDKGDFEGATAIQTEIEDLKEEHTLLQMKPSERALRIAATRSVDTLKFILNAGCWSKVVQV